MKILESFDEFKQKKQQLKNQKTELKKKLGEVRKNQLKVRLDQYNKQQELIKQSMNKFVNSPSEYS